MFNNLQQYLGTFSFKSCKEEWLVLPEASMQKGEEARSSHRSTWQSNTLPKCLKWKNMGNVTSHHATLIMLSDLDTV